jgi:hypothetical protein
LYEAISKIFPLTVKAIYIRQTGRNKKKQGFENQKIWMLLFVILKIVRKPYLILKDRPDFTMIVDEEQQNALAWMEMKSHLAALYFLALKSDIRSSFSQLENTMRLESLCGQLK